VVDQRILFGYFKHSLIIFTLSIKGTPCHV
jgi:hypothetical protein